jgi:hypothetical protein
MWGILLMKFDRATHMLKKIVGGVEDIKDSRYGKCKSDDKLMKRVEGPLGSDENWLYAIGQHIQFFPSEYEIKD